MAGKIFKESNNIYQDQARILFDYYRQAAEKIVSEEERIEKQIEGIKERQAQLEKVPYMLVVGEKEAAEGKVAVRNRGGVDLGAVSVDEFLLKALEEVRTLKLD